VFIGQGALLALIGEGYACIRAITSQRAITFAAKAGAFLLFLAFLPLPGSASLVFVALFPSIVALCIRRVFKDCSSEDQIQGNGPGKEKLLAEEPEAGALRQPEFKRILAYIVVFSMPLGVLRMVIPGRVVPSLDEWALIYAVTFISLCIIFLAEFIFRKLFVPIVSLAIVVLITVDLMLLLFFDTDAMTLNALMNIGYALFVSSFYCYLGSFILSSRHPPFRVFAFGGAANNLGLILGWGLGLLIEHSRPGGISSIFIIGFLYAVFFTSIFVLPIIRKNLFSTQQTEALETIPDTPNIVSSIHERCGLLSHTFQLSSREKEILVLLARGNSLRLIADELTLSMNTVKTHSRHLYKKLGIHTKYELFKLLEDESTWKPLAK
jgi:DNA-binding CsgD family transcriptional regulator